MEKLRQIGLSALVPACLLLAATAAGQTNPSPASPSPASPPPAIQSQTATSSVMRTPAVKRVQILGGKDAVEIEIEGSDRLVPQTQVLTGPDRLVVDFPNAVLGAQLRNQPVNRGEVKDVRVGLFHSSPPVTRVVLDLKSPQSYRIFPNGKTVIIKVSGPAQDAAQGIDDFPPEPATRPGLVTTNYTAGAARLVGEAPPKPALEVTFRDGLLSIKANKASLSEILFAVHQRTGADVVVSAGAEQEKVVAEIGPAPSPEVLARLLNGSKFNFLIVSSANDPRVLDRVILSPKAEGAVVPLPQMPNDEIDEAPVPPPPPPQKAEPAADNATPPTNLPPANQPATNLPAANLPPPRGLQPPPAAQPPSTPPPDDSTPD